MNNYYRIFYTSHDVYPFSIFAHCSFNDKTFPGKGFLTGFLIFGLFRKHFPCIDLCKRSNNKINLNRIYYFKINSNFVPNSFSKRFKTAF